MSSAQRFTRRQFVSTAAVGTAAVGWSGAALGAFGIQNGLSINFDTWQNAGEIAGYHTSILNTATGAEVTAETPLGNIVDGGWHQVGVTWDAQNQVLSYWVDGTRYGSLTGNIAAQYLGNQTSAYLTFTGATGGATDTQQVRVSAIDATFAGGTTNLAFLKPLLSYDTQNVFLSLVTGFAAGAQTSNQRAVGTVLDGVSNTATGDFSAVLNAMANLNTSQGTAALDAISGQVYSGFASANLASGLLFMNAVGQQMAFLHGGSGGGTRVALA